MLRNRRRLQAVAGRQWQHADQETQFRWPVPSLLASRHHRLHGKQLPVGARTHPWYDRRTGRCRTVNLSCDCISTAYYVLRIHSLNIFCFGIFTRHGQVYTRFTSLDHFYNHPLWSNYIISLPPSRCSLSFLPSSFLVAEVRDTWAMKMEASTSHTSHHGIAIVLVLAVLKITGTCTREKRKERKCK